MDTSRTVVGICYGLSYALVIDGDIIFFMIDIATLKKYDFISLMYQTPFNTMSFTTISNNTISISHSSTCSGSIFAFPTTLSPMPWIHLPKSLYKLFRVLMVQRINVYVKNMM